MSSRIARRVDDWPSASAGTGHDGLRTLANEEFTGVIRGGGAEAAMLNGRVVGVFDGALDTFAEQSLTRHEAPHAALPLLLAMQRQEPAPRAQYYTAETPLSQVDQTLASGFTGFVELSDNVLSGDYYVVYYGGRSLSVAFIGESNRLVTDEEAFNRAKDEVGIYEVFDADVTVHDLPDPEPSANEDDQSPQEPTAPPATETAEQAAHNREHEPPTSDETASEQSPDSSLEPPADAGKRLEAGVSTASPTTEPADSHDSPEPDTEELKHPGVEADTAAETDAETTDQPGDLDGEDEPIATVLEDTAVTKIPALDPDRTKQGPTRETTETDSSAPAVVQASGQADRSQENSQKLQSLRDTVATLETEKEELAAQRAAASETIEELEDEIQQLEAKNERLQNRITELETKLETSDEPDNTGPSLTPAEALTQTALFLRYDSKGNATLEDLATTDKSAINENLRIDYHTQFTSDQATVDGDPFAAFVESRIEHRFLSWLVRELVFEIRETGSESALADLYDAIPRIDRVQFNDSIKLPGDADRDSVAFDCIAYDRVGDPLFVARFNNDREPATETMLADLSTDATAAAAAASSIGAAFFVTASFFRPGALETAASATGGGLLSRDARRSHVKISRKQGYHLCLVEAREHGLNLTQPEL